MSKEEFIAVVNAASEMIAKALMSCDAIKTKYVDVVSIDGRVMWNTSGISDEDEYKLECCLGYDPEDPEKWMIEHCIILRRAEDEEDA